MNAQRIINIPAAEKRELRRIAIEKGICIHCLSNPTSVGPRGGKQLCTQCRERAKVVEQRTYRKNRDKALSRFEKRQEALRSEGKCYHCTAPVTPTPSGRIPWLCVECKKRSSERRKPNEVSARREQRLKAMALYGDKCHECGYSDIRALEFHHILFNGKEDGDRRGRGNHLVNRILKDGIDPTIVLVCANCHKIRHWNDLVSPRKLVS